MASGSAGGRLSGKTAVVVGAGQTEGETIGNGRAVAVLFAREGARVLLVDRREDSVRETRELIVAEGGDAEIHVADITDEDACAGLAARAVDQLGRIDVLHNNVGIARGDGPPVEIEADAWDLILDVEPQGDVAHVQARRATHARPGRGGDREHLVARGGRVPPRR